MTFAESYTFDDVLLEPSSSNVLPHQVDISTFITSKIKLEIPLISAAMDTVTEYEMAIAMAQTGGIGAIHKNMSIERQSEEVRKVKKYESGMIIDPITINPDMTLRQALEIMSKNGISGIPVVEKSSHKLVGILTNRDVRFVENLNILVSELMTKENLVTAKQNTSKDEAKILLHKHRIEKLIIVDDNYRCTGLITVKDIEKAKAYPNASKDDQGRLRVAAAIGTGKDSIMRAESLIDAGVDLIIVDTAHGHSEGVIKTAEKIKKEYNIQLVAGNIATYDAARALIDVGVDAVKVGIGPGSICTTRIVAGVGVPQLTAIMNVAKACKGTNVKVIADGGIKFSGDIAKAIAAGADMIMIGSLFAGVKESPGETVLYQGRAYKTYRGMGSIGAMAIGSADRYFQQGTESKKLVPEGVEGRVPFKGDLSEVVHQLTGGLRASMGYTGNKNISEMQTKCKMVKITNAGLRESHAHDIIITREAPNYGYSNES